MKKTLSTSDVAHALLADEYAKWAYKSAYKLAEYYEQLEQDTGEEMELDVVAIRCDWDEYASHKEIADAYDIDGLEELSPEDDEKEYNQIVEEYLSEHTTFLNTDTHILVLAF